MATQRQKQKVQDAAMKLAAAKTAYDLAQREFDDAFKEATSVAKPRKGTALQSDSPQEGGSPVDTSMVKIERHLLSDQNKSFSYNEIATATGIQISSVKAFLYRLKKSGKVTKVGRGLWQATQPNLLKVVIS